MLRRGKMCESRFAHECLNPTDRDVGKSLMPAKHVVLGGGKVVVCAIEQRGVRGRVVC